MKCTFPANINYELPAFPNPISSHGAQETGPGLSKREYIAVAAMNQMLNQSQFHGDDVRKFIAKSAVLMADEMLKALEKQE